MHTHPPTHIYIINLFFFKKKKQLNHSGIEPEAMRTVNSAGNATEDYSWVCGFHEPFFWLGSQLFLITEDAISEKDLVSQSCWKSSKSVNKPLKGATDVVAVVVGVHTDPFPHPNSE